MSAHSTPLNPAPVPVDSEGRATDLHVASHHVITDNGQGEVTLCGVLITYATWKGTAPGAKPCIRCEELDA